MKLRKSRHGFVFLPKTLEAKISSPHRTLGAQNRRSIIIEDIISTASLLEPFVHSCLPKGYNLVSPSRPNHGARVKQGRPQSAAVPPARNLFLGGIHEPRRFPPALGIVHHTANSSDPHPVTGKTRHWPMNKHTIHRKTPAQSYPQDTLSKLCESFPRFLERLV